MLMCDRDTATPIRWLSDEEEARYLAAIGQDPYGFVPRDLFDPGVPGWVYAV